MNNIFTLDSLREETKRKFEPFVVRLADGSDVVLRSVLRLAKADREAVSAALSDFQDLDTESEDDSTLELAVEAISKVFNLIADKPAKLLRELDGDDLLFKLSMMSDLLMRWAQETQLGEAKNSPAL